MQTSHILLLCILGAALLSSAIANTANSPKDCCFSFYPRRVNKKLIREYYMTDSRCAKTGVILQTRRNNKHICADPSLSWVQDLMQYLDESEL